VHVQDGALQHPLDAQRLLGIALDPGGQHLHLFGEELLQVQAQLLDVDAAGAQDPAAGRLGGQRVEQVFKAQVLMPALPRLTERGQDRTGVLW
jgi:hypothetical protein